MVCMEQHFKRMTVINLKSATPAVDQPSVPLPIMALVHSCHTVSFIAKTNKTGFTRKETKGITMIYSMYIETEGLT